MQEDKSGEHKAAWEKIDSAHGILVPGGFGIRGVEGMVLAAKYAREKGVPYLGICLGMQVGLAACPVHAACWYSHLLCPACKLLLVLVLRAVLFPGLLRSKSVHLSEHMHMLEAKGLRLLATIAGCCH